MGLAAGGMLPVTYALLAHYSNATPGHAALGTLLAAGPVWLLALLLAWRSATRATAVAACVMIAVLALVYWRSLAAHFPWLYLAQQAGTYALLGAAFGRTLSAGVTPLCTRFAARVHGPLPNAVARYTRSVTVAWTVFFAIIAVALVTIFFLAPLRDWSAFANFCTPLLVAAMFVIEQFVRRRALPGLEHVGIFATIRAASFGAK